MRTKKGAAPTGLIGGSPRATQGFTLGCGLKVTPSGFLVERPSPPQNAPGLHVEHMSLRKTPSGFLVERPSPPQNAPGLHVEHMSLRKTPSGLLIERPSPLQNAPGLLVERISPRSLRLPFQSRRLKIQSRRLKIQSRRLKIQSRRLKIQSQALETPCADFFVPNAGAPRPQRAFTRCAPFRFSMKQPHKTAKKPPSPKIHG